jgi:ketosteroid isomerase-like protein
MAPQTPPPPAPEPPPPAPVAVAPPPKPTMLETQLAFEKIYGASLGQPEKIIAFFAPDAVMWNIGEPEVKGREAILQTMREIDSHATDFKLADSRVWTRSNTLVLQYVGTSTDKESGKPVSLSGCEIFTFNDDGLIVTDHAYADFTAILEQTGKYKGPDGPPVLLPLPFQPPELHAAKNDATEQTNAANVAAASAALLKKDDKAYFDFFADDASWYDFTRNGVPPRDKKYEMAELVAQHKAVDVTAIKDVNVIAVEDFTIDEQEVTLTQKAPYAFGKVHIPNTKKSATVHSVEIDQWQSGKIVSSWYWGSTYELDAQLGVGPAAKPAKPAAPAAKK